MRLQQRRRQVQRIIEVGREGGRRPGSMPEQVNPVIGVLQAVNLPLEGRLPPPLVTEDGQEFVPEGLRFRVHDRHRATPVKTVSRAAVSRS